MVGPRRCFHSPEFKLTCDRGSELPRLLLGNDSGGGALEVVSISPENNTMRVISHGVHAMNMSGSGGQWSWSLGAGLPYTLLGWGINEFILLGCNLQAKLLSNGSGGSIISGCASFCSTETMEWYEAYDKRCSNNGCCLSSIPMGDAFYGVELRRLDRGLPEKGMQAEVPVSVLIAETGWFHRDLSTDLTDPTRGQWQKTILRVPLILSWVVPQGTSHDMKYPGEAAWRICKSTNSEPRAAAYFPVRGNSCECKEGYQGNPYITGGCQDIKECDQKEEHGCFGDCEELPGTFQCRCPEGYQGNPYLTGGCQDIKECDQKEEHGCFGDCEELPGTFRCRCPEGFHGNYSISGGCFKSVNTGRSGLIIGLSVASGPCILLLILGALLIIRDIEQHKGKMMRQKFFNQNRGQLLKQLVSHRADIAERMIIPLEELQKATNNFDQVRRLGGGGHGTVYKGILSDLHVVAIKKSNIVVKREIDEFINEVAILSQINHRNIVKLHGCCLETEVPLLAYEFICNGTLSDHLHTGALGSLSWDDRLRIASEIGKALGYLHSSVTVPVIHMDIKPSNILLDDALIAKISDFGASRYIPMDKTGLTTITAVQGTIGYLDPMYYYTGRLTECSDVYSFGVLLVELLTRKNPSSYRSSEGDGLVMQFVELLAEGNLAEILDPQVLEEAGTEVEEVAILLCHA
ncbi:hypothetical protein CFC21_079265 [Triticum aestivum]|uniref:Protein kinase domain-containing protein n=3 Tax=Triticinae TaxID=1648030 RepID=A0A9R1HZ68_WHEAT|nr:hypothetical protein CFC21_071889 [Triticum aestivum]KAF7074384.1 hypothetical protein CFC21_079255 [Triticum aestivum]KAF7074394.1 hypothetical protein CFC21_079265 [Triticum aestivum]